MERMNAAQAPTAIITSGGGMKCAYAAGALVALAKELKFTEPDFFVAASGSVGGMFYYLSGQYDDIEKAWTRYIPSPDFIRYTPFPTMRIDYLVDTIFKDYLPLDIARFDSSKTRYFVPITDSKTGKVEFVTNGSWFDPYEVMRAAKAVPILYNGHVHLGGRSYLDGDFSTSMMSLVEKALSVGARRILFISNTSQPRGLQRLALRAYAMLQKRALRTGILADLDRTTDVHWPKDLEFVSLCPSGPLPVAAYTRNRREVVEAYNMGRDDLLAMRGEIEALLGRAEPASV